MQFLDCVPFKEDIIIQRILILILVFIPDRVNSATDARIVGGMETTIDQVPYLVNLRQHGQFICGGALISGNCILTAAHCVKGTPPNGLTIHAGASRLSEPAEVRRVIQHFVSPYYSARNLDTDVAILKMESILSGNHIRRIELCSNTPQTGSIVKISGWGITDENRREPTDQVRTANIRVVDRLTCIRNYLLMAHLTTSMFCATVPGKDSCSGDSGGPVVYNGQVCGIVSWGIGCARSNYPGVYTNVSSLRVKSFIKSTLQQNCS